MCIANEFAICLFPGLLAFFYIALSFYRYVCRLAWKYFYLAVYVYTSQSDSAHISVWYPARLSLFYSCKGWNVWYHFRTCWTRCACCSFSVNRSPCIFRTKFSFSVIWTGQNRARKEKVNKMSANTVLMLVMVLLDYDHWQWLWWLTTVDICWWRRQWMVAMTIIRWQRGRRRMSN